MWGHSHTGTVNKQLNAGTINRSNTKQRLRAKMAGDKLPGHIGKLKLLWTIFVYNIWNIVPRNASNFSIHIYVSAYQ